MANSEVTYEVQTWTVASLFQRLEEKKIRIPKFQRNLVWNKDRKRKFIDSLKSGYPFGSILLHASGESPYTLIDGLQRTSTIKSYFTKPTDFFDDDIFTTETGKRLVKVLGISEDELKKCLKNWFTSLDINNLEEFDETHGFTSGDLKSFLSNQFKEIDWNIDISDRAVREFIDEIKRRSDISSRQIPVIIYFGDKNNLPEIFQKLNTGGVALSKYEIFAASWQEAIPTPGREILDKIYARIASYQDEGYSIEFDPEENPITLFDYLYALGKVLAEKYPILFGKSDDRMGVESIGFNLTSYIFDLDVVDMESLEGSFRQKVTTEDELKQWEKSLLHVVDDIYRQLKPYLDFKLNTSNSSRGNSRQFNAPHSEFLMVALIAKAFHMRFPLGELNTRESDKYREYLKRVPSYYIYDILSEHWTGSGNTKVTEIIKGTTNRYDVSIEKKDWESVITGWYKELEQKKETKRSTQTKVAYLFLQYIYAHVLTHHEANGPDSYDLDHLVSISHLNTFMIRNGRDEGLPINHVANIALLPSGTNRQKKEHTIYEFFTEEQIKDLEKYTITERADMAFVDDITEQNFYSFLNLRGTKLKDIFISIVCTE